MPGCETTVYTNGELMDVDSIEFTQKSCFKTFSDKTKPPLLDTMKSMLLGDVEIDDFPFIRVAQDDCGEFHSIDNRRLLIFKVLRIKQVPVKWINWTREFDCKVRQRPVHDPLDEKVTLDVDGIKSFRKLLVGKLFSELGRHHMVGKNMKFRIENIGYTVTPDGGINSYPIAGCSLYQEESDSDSSECSSDESDESDEFDYFHPTFRNSGAGRPYYR